MRVHSVTGWIKLKPTFTFLGRDFVIFNTFSWQNPYKEKLRLVLALHWVASPCKESLSSVRPPILQTQLCNGSRFSPESITRVGSTGQSMGSALKSTRAKIFLSDQPLRRSGQGWRIIISCNSKCFSFTPRSAVSEYCVTAMNLERQESCDHRDWDSFRNTFPTTLSALLRTHFFFTQTNVNHHHCCYRY